MVGELGMALLSYAVFLLYHLFILQVSLVFVSVFAFDIALSLIHHIHNISPPSFRTASCSSDQGQPGLRHVPRPKVRTKRIRGFPPPVLLTFSTEKRTAFSLTELLFRGIFSSTLYNL